MFNPTQSMKLAMSAFETSMAAATTINARMPILFSAAMTGSPRAVRESQRMVTEKAKAAMDGALAANTALFKMWLNMASTMAIPDAEAWLKVTEAALAPAQRACKANAKRLCRPKRRRRK